jgi:purine-nucleoside phosphorylase
VNETLDQLVATAASALASRLPAARPELMLVLGSGLSAVADAIEDPVDVPVEAIDGLRASSVPGHKAVLRHGTLGGRTVLAQLGRIHLYEGHGAADVTRTVEVAHALGAETLVVTNAAGGLHTALTAGDLLLITDQLNLTGDSPLTGVIREGSPVFQDMTRAYDQSLGAAARKGADDLGMTLREGVYAGLRGPAFETPAEVAMLRALGADVVGMSTVLEVIAARSRGMRVLGFSSVTNVHHPEQDSVSHQEVLEVGRTAAQKLARLLLHVIPKL